MGKKQCHIDGYILPSNPILSIQNFMSIDTRDNKKALWVLALSTHYLFKYTHILKPMHMDIPNIIYYEAQL